MSIQAITVPQQQAPKHATKPASRPAKVDPMAELLEFVARATNFAQWLWVYERIIQLGFKLPSKLVYEALKKCPTSFVDSGRHLRAELFDKYRDYIVDGLTTENIGGYERKFMSLIQ